jgi:hypothetical protein
MGYGYLYIYLPALAYLVSLLLPYLFATNPYKKKKCAFPTRHDETSASLVSGRIFNYVSWALRA